MATRGDARGRPTTAAGARVAGGLLRWGVVPVVVLDATRILLAYVVALMLRFDGAVPDRHWETFFKFAPIVVAAHLISYWRLRLYEQVWRHASVTEAVRVVEASGVALLFVLALDLVQSRRVPISVIVLGSTMTVLLTGAARFQSRLVGAFNRRRTKSGVSVVLIGDDETVALMIRAMRANDGPGALVPAAVLSADGSEMGRSLLGVPIRGTIESLPEVARTTDASFALLAVSDPGRALMQRAVAAAEEANLPLKIVPDARLSLRGGAIARAVRDVRIEDLLGRQQVTVDERSLRDAVQGRRVLVTGAGGSIGSEITRQIARLEPEAVILVDHDETHLFDAAADLDVTAVQALADVRDRAVVFEVFERHRPDVVFHAAAHKHVPLLEAHPCEAVRTNVQGTQHVLEAAAASGVDRLVFISTDKAVDPSSVMGTSKWFGERLVQLLAPAGARWCSVRFGNVLGSRGSVIPTFRRQIEAGGPVTITDPRMTRYFMSTQEAVQLVLQAATFASGGETFILEMGEPINILELARKMIRLSGYAPGTDIGIEITGIRPGEKLDEILHTPFERVLPTPHDGIRRIVATPPDREDLARALDKLGEIVRSNDDAAATSVLLDLPAHHWAINEVTWSPASI